mmetsp:Transcript_144824/g.464195  ORF Transcript_144824/g.464195 Transcript_144824/m.464195 type:complete len:305 (-) Transcript_144824:119-1033(-)
MPPACYDTSADPSCLPRNRDLGCRRTATASLLSCTFSISSELLPCGAAATAERLPAFVCSPGEVATRPTRRLPRCGRRFGVENAVQKSSQATDPMMGAPGGWLPTGSSPDELSSSCWPMAGIPRTATSDVAAGGFRLLSRSCPACRRGRSGREASGSVPDGSATSSLSSSSSSCSDPSSATLNVVPPEASSAVLAVATSSATRSARLLASRRSSEELRGFSSSWKEVRMLQSTGPGLRGCSPPPTSMPSSSSSSSDEPTPAAVVTRRLTGANVEGGLGGPSGAMHRASDSTSPSTRPQAMTSRG